jgi:hypothetical protein
MYTSNCKEQPNKQEDVSRRKKDGAVSENSITVSVNYGSVPDYQIYIPLGWAPW